MMQRIISKLTDTKWGWAIPFKKGLAFLDYTGDCSKFNSNTAYECQIFYKILFAKRPEKQCKEWICISRNTSDALYKNPNFKRYNLKKEDIYPCFKILEKY